VGRLIKLLVALLLLHAVWRVGTTYWTYVQLQEEIREIALFAGPLDPADVAGRVAAAAERRGVPLERDRIAVRREGTRTFIDASYDTSLEILPTFQYPWTFRLSAEGWAGALFEKP
jgi:hypothetical protein